MASFQKNVADPVHFLKWLDQLPMGAEAGSVQPGKDHFLAKYLEWTDLHTSDDCLRTEFRVRPDEDGTPVAEFILDGRATSMELPGWTLAIAAVSETLAAAKSKDSVTCAELVCLMATLAMMK